MPLRAVHRKPTSRMMAFQVPEGVLMMLATNGLLRVKVYRNCDLWGYGE